MSDTKKPIDCSYSGISDIVVNGAPEEAIALCQALYSSYQADVLIVEELEKQLKAARFNMLNHKRGLFYIHKQKKLYEKPLVFPTSARPNAPLAVISVDEKEVSSINEIEITAF